MGRNINDAALRRLKSIYLRVDTNGDLTDELLPMRNRGNLDKMLSYVRKRKQEGLSHCTVTADIKSLIEFSKVCTKPIRDLDENDVYNFFDSMESKASATIAMRKKIISAFLRFCEREDLLELFRFKNSQAKRKLPEDMLTQEDIERLLEAATTLRDKAYIATLYETGAREGELEELQIKHVSFDEHGAVITIPKGKTGARRNRVIFASGYLRQWLEVHPHRANREAWVWASSYESEKHVTYDNIRKTLQRTATKAGIQKRVNPHVFRHSRATHLAQHLTEQQMKVALGWTSGSNMASIYVHLSGKDLDNAVLKMNGIDIGEEAQENKLKIIKCPRCKEMQDKKNLFCFKCGMPLSREFEAKIDNEFQEASKSTINFNDPEVRAQLMKYLEGKD